MKRLFFFLIALCSMQGVNAQEAVDLGLSVDWATHDVGAMNPYEMGTYYVMGTTIPLSSTKSPVKHIIDHKVDISGNPEYDVATACWGEQWRTPTYMEWSELMTSCSWEYEKKKDENGKSVAVYRITGPNGNCIFINAPLYRMAMPFSKLCSTPHSKKKGMWMFIMTTNNKYALWGAGKNPYYCAGAVRPIRNK